MKRLLPTLALAAMLALPQGALAATSSETLIVSQADVLTGVPATLDYGTIGDLTEHGADPFTITYNTAGAATLNVTVTAFTGPDTIPVSARRIHAGSSDVPGLVSGVPVTVITIGAGGTSGDQTLEVSPFITLPSMVAPGTYSGSMTWTLD